MVDLASRVDTETEGESNMNITIRVVQGRYGDQHKWHITQDISVSPNTIQSAGYTYYAPSQDVAMERAKNLATYWREAGEHVNPILFGSERVNRELGIAELT